MKMKTLMAAFAIAVAGAAFPADTNYTEYAEHMFSPWTMENHIGKDVTLAGDADRAAVMRQVDAVWAQHPDRFEGWDPFEGLPQTAAAVLSRADYLSEAVKTAILGSCAEGRGIVRVTLDGNPQKVNYVLQRMAAGRIASAEGKRRVLDEAVRQARRAIRAKGESFVGQEGLARVKGYLDGVAAGLNAPRFAGLKESLGAIGISAEWDFIGSAMLTDEEIQPLVEAIMSGDEPFTGTHQCRLSVCLGVSEYNALVKRYNGK